MGREAASEWAQAFARGLIKKMYLAVVTPAPADADGVIVSEVYKGVPSGGSVGGYSRERMISRPSSGRRRKDNDDDDDRSAIGAKSAVTEWKLLHRGGSGALLLLQPVTGRTHQLRVHCADVLKCPVVGDRKYGPASSQTRDEAGTAGGRLQLHAAALVVPQSLVTPQLLKLCKPATSEHASSPASNAVVKLNDGRCCC
jgi:23S rRNA-/tRNA-specific pseudouridylate synthase